MSSMSYVGSRGRGAGREQEDQSLFLSTSFRCSSLIPVIITTLIYSSNVCSEDLREPVPAWTVQNFAHFSEQGCIRFGEIKAPDSIVVRELCIKDDNQPRTLGMFETGGEFLASAEPGILLFYQDSQPVWYYAADQNPKPLAYQKDMDGEEWEQLFELLGGEELQQAAAPWLNESTEKTSILEQGLATGVGAMATEVISMLGLRLISELLSPKVNESGWSQAWNKNFIAAGATPARTLAFSPVYTELLLRVLLQGQLTSRTIPAFINMGYDLPVAYRYANKIGKSLSALVFAVHIMTSFSLDNFGRYAVAQTVINMATSYLFFARSYETEGFAGSLTSNFVYSVLQYAFANCYLRVQQGKL